MLLKKYLLTHNHLKLAKFALMTHSWLKESLPFAEEAESEDDPVVALEIFC